MCNKFVEVYLEIKIKNQQDTTVKAGPRSKKYTKHKNEFKGPCDLVTVVSIRKSSRRVAY